MIKRDLEAKIEQALDNFRIVLLSGPRQSGKTTLVNEIAKNRDMSYVTLDDQSLLDFAKSDPKNFLAFYSKKPLVIDEIQYAPELVKELKMYVDNSNTKGMFLLTGSADLINMNQVTESLAGRMVTYHLYPLSTKEIYQRDENMIDYLFSEDITQIDVNSYTQSLSSIIEHVLVGGYPEVQELEETFRGEWFESYMDARVKKDIVELKNININRIENISKLLILLANQTGSILNINQLSKKLQIDNKTTQSYISILESMFILKRVLPYFTNKHLSVVKSPKINFIDTGVVCSILGIDADNLLTNKNEIYGNIIENFIYTELLKQATTSKTSIKIEHFRDLRKKEVDFILEKKDGNFIAIEVKAKSIIKKDDLKGLIELIKKSTKLLNAFVVYSGEEIRPFSLEGKMIYLLPMRLFV